MAKKVDQQVEAEDKVRILAPDFVTELFAHFLHDKKILSLLSPYVNFSSLPTNAHKLIWENVYASFNVSKEVPTMGTLFETFKLNSEVTSILSDVKDVNVYDTKVDTLCNKFEEFHKYTLFVQAYKQTQDKWKTNKDEAMRFMMERSNEAYNFSIKTQSYPELFSTYKERQEKRQNRDRNLFSRVDFGIKELDYYSRGGMLKGTSTAVLARSKVGKSTFLRWVALNAARMGRVVVYFQCEDTEENAYEAFDAAWTGQDIVELEEGIAPEEDMARMARTINALGGKLYLIASQLFGSLSIQKAREVIINIEKSIGQSVDLVCYDYLELFKLDGAKHEGSQYGERKKRADLSQLITNTAVELNHAALVASQASDVPKEQWNDPSYLLTASNSSEHKGLVRDYAMFLTLNQTLDEYENQRMRIHVADARKMKSRQVIHIAQSPSNGRFYDSERTDRMFWDSELNQKIGQ